MPKRSWGGGCASMRGMSPDRTWLGVARSALATLAVAGAVVFSIVPAAGAAYTHKPLLQLGEIPPEGPLGEHIALPGPLESLEATTIDAGHLWAAERVGGKEASRIDEFNATTAEFMAQPVHAEYPTIYGGNGEGGIAVGHGTGEPLVYAAALVIAKATETANVSVFDETGALKKSWTGAAAPFGPFYKIYDVAVDNSTAVSDAGKGDVYVVTTPSKSNQTVVDVFHPEVDGEEHYVGQIAGPSPSEPFGFALRVGVNESTGEVVVLDLGSPKAKNAERKRTLDIFKPSGSGQYEFVRKISGPPPNDSFGEIYALGVDSGKGEIYVTEPILERSATRLDEFSATGSYLGEVEGVPNIVYSIAVNPESHALYISNALYGPDVVVPDVTTNPPANLRPESVLLSGTVNPDNAGNASCQFDWGTTPALGKTVPCPSEVANGESPVPVQVALGGLERGVTYYYRLQAGNTEGTNPGEPWQTESFTTPGALIRAESVEDVSATAATLLATIDPNQTPTSYYFEYGPTSSYGQRAPALPGEALGSGTLDVEPGQRVQGLSPGTVYHYRVVAVNELKPHEFEWLDGEDRTFTTQPASAPSGLADARSWELVSPASKLGALIAPFGKGAVQASSAGDAIAYQTSSPTEGEPQGFPAFETVLSTRGTDGWSSHDISPPLAHEAGIQSSSGDEFRLFSSDLSLAAVTPVSIAFTPLSADATESTTYLRSDYPGGDVGALCSTSCYQPLVTASNTPSGTVFGEEPKGECPWHTCGPHFKAASSDLEHVILGSPVQLTSTPAPVREGLSEGGPEGVYEWSAGQLRLVGVPPQGEQHPVILAGENHSMIGHAAVGVRHAVSENGERVILEGGEFGGKALYLREVGAEQTTRLDVAQGGMGPSAGLSYMTASSDASRIFFLDSGRLTANSSASGEDLYEYDLNAPAGSRLSDLTADSNAGEAAGVIAVIGASEDGSYVYFVAKGALSEGAQPGGLNLYERHAGITKLIATLAQEDALLIEPHLYARVSPNGEWLTFMSRANLTGYDTRDALSGHPDAEVYLYHAAGEGRLACASCNPTGARPVGLQIGGETGQLVAKGELEGWVAANIMPWLELTQNFGGHASAVNSTYYQPRYLSDSGRVFFDSTDALVPQDVNGTEDVYEFEPTGVGRCDSSSQTFAPRSQGCVDLISSGSSPHESALIDASENGGDVFFMTQARLVSQDYDNAYDVYDAHECSSASPCFPVAAAQPPECETEASCRAAPKPQPALYGAPSSATFSGTGNVAAPTPTTLPVAKPKARPKAKKAKCVKRKVKRKCAKKAGKSKRTTGAGSRRGGHR